MKLIIYLINISKAWKIRLQTSVSRIEKGKLTGLPGQIDNKKKFFSIKGKKNGLIDDIKLGINRGNEISQLPPGLEKIHNNLIVRSIRFCLGINFMLFILNKNGVIIFENKYNMVILILAIIQIMYIVFISISRIYNIYINLKKGRGKIYNSPFNFRASLITQGWACIKGFCYSIGATGGTIGAFYIFDETVLASGRKAIFKPIAGKLADKLFTSIGYVKHPEIELLNKVNNETKNLIHESEEFREAIKDLKFYLTDKENLEIDKIVNTFNEEEKEKFFAFQEKILKSIDDIKKIN